MKKTIQIVQFTHPGDEHRLTKSELITCKKNWNYGRHQRKFLKAEGKIVDDKGLVSNTQELMFWGEWEPDSYVTPLPPSSTMDMPHYLHEPILEVDAKKSCVKAPISNVKKKLRQNTDPSVFGDTFLYSCCKQHRTVKGKSAVAYTKMATLEKGSIILFGSTKKDAKGDSYFALDTVFVVSDYLEYYPKTFASTHASFVSDRWYDQIMGYCGWLNVPFICYKGATPTNPINGMYSFSPCQTCGQSSVGFPRVQIRKKDLAFITDNLNAAPKHTSSSLILNKQYWDKICEMVKAQGCEKGVDFGYKIDPK